jgi:hypothetical protein
MNEAYVVGVGMIPFVKPGANKPYPQRGAAAVRAALADAGQAGLPGPPRLHA